MIKEIKYLFFIIVIFLSLFLILRFYFSETNIKKSYRVLNEIDQNTNIDENNLIILNNDTDNIIDYVNQKIEGKDDKFKFWELFKKN